MPVMNYEATKEQYEKDGFVLFESLFDSELIQDLQKATDELIEDSKNHLVSDDRFDLEKDHSPSNP